MSSFRRHASRASADESFMDNKVVYEPRQTQAKKFLMQNFGAPVGIHAL